MRDQAAPGRHAAEERGRQRRPAGLVDPAAVDDDEVEMVLEQALQRQRLGPLALG